MKKRPIMEAAAAVSAALLFGGFLTLVFHAEASPSRTPDMICHPVEGNGETGTGWNLISPDQKSVHIDEATGEGKHTRKDGRTDVVLGDDLLCPGEPTDNPTDPTTVPTDEPTDPTEPTDTPTTDAPAENPTPDDRPTCRGRPVLGGPCAPTDEPVEHSCSATKCTTKHSDGSVTVIEYGTDVEEEGL